MQILKQNFNMLTIRLQWLICYAFVNQNRHSNPFIHPPVQPNLHPPHLQSVKQWDNQTVLELLSTLLMLNYIKNNTLIIILNFSVRFRYGNIWAPRHPSTPVTGTSLYSLTLREDESLETLEFMSGWAIDSLRFNTNKRSSGQLGGLSSLHKQMFLKGVAYFTGAWIHFSQCYGYQVSKLSPRMWVCQSWTLWGSP